MKKKITIVFLLGFVQAGISQVSSDDSLLLMLQKMQDDTTKSRKLREAGTSNEMINADFARKYYYEAIAVSKRIKAPAEQSLNILQLAGFYINTNKYDSAEIVVGEAIEIAKKNNNSLDEARGYNILANSYRRRSQYPKAIENYLKAASVFEKVNDKKRTALVYSGITAVYAETNENEKGISYGQKAIAFALESKDPDAIAKCYFNTGAAYGTTNEEKYIELYKKGIPFALQTGNPVLIQQGYYNIANGYYQMGKDSNTLFQGAAQYADSSLQWAKKTGNPLNLFYASNIAAQVAILNKKLLQADAHLEITAKSLEQVSSNFTNRIYYSTLANLRYEQGRYKEAYEYQKKQDVFKDSILSEDKLDAQREIEAKFETEKKDNQLKLQKSQLTQRKTLNYLFGGSALAAISIGLLGYRNYSNRKKVDTLRINELEKEKQLAATEAVLKGEEQERTRLAKDLHDGLGGMLSGIKYSFNTMKGNLVMTPDNAQAFERSMDMLDSSIKEMRRVAHNMMPEALVKFGLDAALKDFCNDINQTGALQISYESVNLKDADINQSTSITVYRIVQELINNTMKHASAKTAIVQLIKNNNQLSVTVEDDGKGFNIAILDEIKKGRYDGSVGRGIGWENIQNRVKFLNGQLDVDAEEGKGTTVNIEITV
jgi:two-component system, NarL family, sensor kinase